MCVVLDTIVARCVIRDSNHLLNRIAGCTWQMLFLLAIFLLSGSEVFAGISGTVFRDLPVTGSTANTYGTMQPNESGVENVTVTAYYTDGSTQTMQTPASGAWNFTSSLDARVEFSNWPTYLEESPDGNGQNSSVRFVADAGTANFGLHNPADFSQPNPKVAIVHHMAGLSSAAGPTNALISFDYNSSGISPVLTTEAVKADVGTLWGLAYSRTRKQLFSAAFLKRHSGLSGNLGAIYQSDIGTAGADATLFLTIPNVGTLPARDLGAFNAFSHDAAVVNLVGKIGLGDIDISEDEKTLYAINLNTKSLIEIDIDTATVTGTFPVSGPTCTSGEFRPFALNYNDGLVYVGGVCDASTDAPWTSDTAVANGGNLEAFIVAFDPASTNFSAVIDFPLNYQKGGSAWAYMTATGPNAIVGVDGTPDHHADKWYRWADYSDNEYNFAMFNPNNSYRIAHPQPILSDIEFTASGDMIIGLMDRVGHQFGNDNYLPDNRTIIGNAFSGGEILKAAKTGASWTIESHVTSGGVVEEFFTGDFKNPVDGGHFETSDASFAVLLGSEDILLTAMDPIVFNSGGTLKLSTTAAHAASVDDLEIFRGSIGVGEFAKSTGLGDIELLSDPSPVEIGNRVWRDVDGDGIQDADEGGIPGVIVELYDSAGTTLLATATTDTNGNYIFSSDPNGPAPSPGDSRVFRISALTPDTAYTVRIPDIIGNSQQTVLKTYQLTTEDVGEGVLADSNDSDGITTGNNAEAVVAATDIPLQGANNHSFDFGFVPLVSLGSTVFFDNDNNGLQETTEAGIPGVTVKLFASDGTTEILVGPDGILGTADDAAGGVVTDAAGDYLFTGLASGSYIVKATPVAAAPLSSTDIGSTTADNDIDGDDNGTQAAPGDDAISPLIA
ncbi:MAG TPA: hypothetical protein ENJ32_11150, partial [Crenotrichaceae bacterium]|nr:hypothetical protein [Crenotrichaceae bacterium]